MIKLKGNALWTNKRKSFFIQYIVNLPNSLPQGVIETSAVAGFQRGLDNFMAVIKTRSPGAQITIGLIQPCSAAHARTVGPSGGSCPHVLNVLDGARQGIYPPLTRHGVLSLICDYSLFLSKNKRRDPRVSQRSPIAIGPLALRDLCGRWWPQPVACSMPGTRALPSSDAGAAGPGAALLRGTMMWSWEVEAVLLPAPLLWEHESQGDRWRLRVPLVSTRRRDFHNSNWTVCLLSGSLSAQFMEVWFLISCLCRRKCDNFALQYCQSDAFPRLLTHRKVDGRGGESLNIYVPQQRTMRRCWTGIWC